MVEHPAYTWEVLGSSPSRRTKVMKKLRFKVIPAVYLFLIKEDKVLLLRRFNTGYEDGNYSFPAGHIDGDESVTSAIIRETEEEIGVRLDPKDLSVVHVMHRRTESKDNERMDIFLKALKWEGEIKNVEPHKCDDLSWFSVEDLPKNTIPYIKTAFENYRKNIYFSEFGW